MNKVVLSGIMIFSAASFARAQEPRISGLFPAGAQAGQSVDVSVKGGGLVGAKRVIVTGGPGVTAELAASNVQIDETAKPLFQAKCTSCHEARSPANRSLNVDQWAQTVDRMIGARGADIAKPDRDKIVTYLQNLSRAGEIGAKVIVDKNATPGFREVRVLTDHGVSSAYNFEVGALPEVVAQEKTTREAPQKLTLPVVVNGTMANGGQRNFFSFEAKKGERLTFNLKGFRLNELSQSFFNPTLFLYDAQGREVGKDLGRFGLDPVLDWTAPEAGTYTLLVRDLIWRGSPASIYRLAIGSLPYEGVLTTFTARPGQSLSTRMASSVSGDNSPFSLTAPDGASGVMTVNTPMGEATLLVRDLPDGGPPNGANAAPVALPAVFRGVLTRANQTDTFKVKSILPNTALEIYAHRLGSPVHPKVTVRDAKGNLVRERNTIGGEDFRIDGAFPQPGEYTVEVSDADGNSGSANAYSWEALGDAPDFALTVTPDGASLAPGGSLPLLVRVTRRDNLKGPIVLSAFGLPPGVTATVTPLLENDDKAIIVLTAEPGATMNGTIAGIIGRATGANGTELSRRARPMEVTRVNNNPHPFERTAQIVAVGSDGPPFALALADGSKQIALLPNEEKKITVRVTRQNNYKGDVQVSFLGVPPGINVQNTVNVPADKEEAVFTIRANGDAPLFKAAPEARPRLVFVGATNSSGDSPLACTPLITLVPQEKPAEPPK